MKRQHDVWMYRLDDESERRAAADLEAYTPPDWYELEGRLVAFGSMRVVNALQVTADAHGDAIGAFQAPWTTSASGNGRSNGSASSTNSSSLCAGSATSYPTRPTCSSASWTGLPSTGPSWPVEG